MNIEINYRNLKKKLENVRWFVRPLHIGDPIPWRVMFEKIIGY